MEDGVTHKWNAVEGGREGREYQSVKCSNGEEREDGGREGGREGGRTYPAPATRNQTICSILPRRLTTLLLSMSGIQRW